MTKKRNEDPGRSTLSFPQRAPLPEVEATIRMDARSRETLRADALHGEDGNLDETIRMSPQEIRAAIECARNSAGSTSPQPEAAPPPPPRAHFRKLGGLVVMLVVLSGVLWALIQQTKVKRSAREATAAVQAPAAASRPADRFTVAADEIPPREAAADARPADRAPSAAGTDPNASDLAPSTPPIAAEDLAELDKELARLEQQLAQSGHAAGTDQASAPQAAPTPAGIAAAPQAQPSPQPQAEADAALTRFIAKTSKDETAAAQLAATLQAASSAAGMDPRISAAIVMAESSFNPNAANQDKIGLLQLSPKIEAQILMRSGMPKATGAELRDPAYNLTLGLSYVNFLQARYNNNLEHALISYNLGVDEFEQLREKGGPLPPVTKRFLQRVELSYRQLAPGAEPLHFTLAVKRAEAAATPAPAAAGARADLAAILKTTALSPLMVTELARRLEQESARAGLDPRLAAAVIMAESSFNPAAVSDDGKIGLLQIHPERAPRMAEAVQLEWSGPEQLHDTTYNLRLGLGFLAAAMNNAQQDFTAALLAYNLGDEAAREILAGNTAIEPLTARYLHNVKKYMAQYRAPLAAGWRFSLEKIPAPVGPILAKPKP